MTLVPAYGRDYKSKKAIIEAIAEGKSFIIADHFHPSDGKPCTPRDDFAGQIVYVRYKKLTQIAKIQL